MRLLLLRVFLYTQISQTCRLDSQGLEKKSFGTHGRSLSGRGAQETVTFGATSTIACPFLSGADVSSTISLVSHC